MRHHACEATSSLTTTFICKSNVLHMTTDWENAKMSVDSDDMVTGHRPYYEVGEYRKLAKLAVLCAQESRGAIFAAGEMSSAL